MAENGTPGRKRVSTTKGRVFQYQLRVGVETACSETCTEFGRLGRGNEVDGGRIVILGGGGVCVDFCRVAERVIEIRRL